MQRSFVSFFIVTGFLLQWLHLFYTAFFYQSQEDKREREWMSKQCQKLRSKVKESFFKSVNFLSKSVCIYTLYHIAFGHFILWTVLFSLQISKYYWFVFVWYIICLIFTIQHILIILFLSEFSFESLSFCLLLRSFTALQPDFTVKVLFFVKHNSPESSTSKARFKNFCKLLSIYPLFIRCVQEKQFC